MPGLKRQDNPMCEDSHFVSKLTAKEITELENLIPKYKQKVIDRLKMVESIDNLKPSNQLKVIGWFTDFGADLTDKSSLSKGIELGESIDASDLDSKHRGMLHYRLGTAFSNRSTIRSRDENPWRWELPDIEPAMRHYRQAIDEADFEELPLIDQWRALTNLGNLYSEVGRFVEAFDYWNEALIRQPYWFPARGQRGIGFYTYAEYDYDTGHQAILLKKGYDELETVQLDSIVGLSPEKTIKHFLQFQDRISSRFESSTPPDDILDFDDCDLGESDQERRYRRWCLNHRLFLNTLNDATTEPIAAQDNLQLGQLRMTETERIVSCLGLWNQLVEEYVTARYLLYEGTNPESDHFADRDVQIMNTLDYPIHSIFGEKLKIALRTAYSIFDKVGQFINYYFNCGRPTEDLSFADIWYIDPHSDELQEQFQDKPNLPLRGLYWLSKDIETGDLHVEGSLDESGRKLTDVRNALEHRYVKLVMYPSREQESDTTRFSDELATTMLREELERYALKMVRRARAALIYLALGINAEEESKPKPDEPAVPLQFGPLQPGPQ